jgi:salicylate hydroxylase
MSETQSPAPRTAIIAGAGIGGLTAALELARAGLAVRVFEKSPVISEVGAGLQLAPNSTRLLRELGVLEQVQRYAVAPDYLRLRRARDGQELARMPLGAIAELRWGAPSLSIHRADLQRVLLEACAAHRNITVTTGMSVAGFSDNTHAIEIAVREGDTTHRIHGDVLIGADGLRSQIRSNLALGEGDQPIWSGRTAWRACVPVQEAPLFARKLETSLWLGAQSHLVHYPIRGGELINIVAITEDEWRGDSTTDLWAIAGEAKQVAPRFARWHRDARDLIERAKDWKRWPLFDRQPVRRWSLGGAAVLGDAAHPMLPFFAQGAGQAIEDAAALGRAFKETRDVREALTHYERNRTARAEAVVLASRRQGTIYHLSGPFALARDITLRSLSASRFMAQVDWLYKG